MADTPNILSKEQIAGQIIDSFLSRSKTVNDLTPGSVLLSLINAFAEAGFKVSADMINAIDALSIDRASGEALKRIANDNNVPILSSTSSTGFINIFDISFAKIQDKIYPGLPAPVAGTNIVYVSDGSKFPTAGQIYIGRGTNSVEGPLTYTSIVPLNSGSYYQITLASGSETTKFHNLGETVILAQGGNRVIPVGTSAQTSQGVASEAISFTTTLQSIILDGETEVDNVPIASSITGTDANVSRGAIVQVVGLSFPSTCYNDLPITNAIPDDTDDSLRERIKAYAQSRTKGTEQAIINAAIGVTSPDDLRRVLSADVLRQAGTEQILIFDDGSGYEPIDSGIGLEQIIDSALGGEKEFQLLNPMIERATVKTINQEPYDLQGGNELIVTITGVNVPVHTFQSSDFKTFRSASAYEVVASVNANSLLPYVARTINGGTGVSLTPKTANEIQVLSSDANSSLNFPTNRIYTARLYRDDVPQFQDGLDAFVDTLPQSSWTTISNGDKIKYTVDGTTPVIVTITDAMFQKIYPTYQANQFQSINVWAQVLNAALPGVSVQVVGQALRFVSNLGASSSASIVIETADSVNYAIGSAMFGSSVVSSTGRTSDYNLNLKTAQLEWITPLTVGESATAGSKFTRAKIDSVGLSSTLVFPGTNIQLFMIVDGGALPIQTDIDISQPIVFTTGSNSEVTITATGGQSATHPFDNVSQGDWLVLWNDTNTNADPIANQFSPGNRGAYRVKRKVNNQTLVIVNASGTNESKTITNPSRFTVVRSLKPVQYANINTSLIATPSDLALQLEASFDGVDVLFIGNVLRVQSKTPNDSISEIFVAAFSQNFSTLGITVGKYVASPSHNGFLEAAENDSYGTPTFKLFSIDSGSITQNSFINNDYQLGGGTGNDLIQYLNYNTGVAPLLDQATNKNTVQLVKNYDPSISTLTVQDNLLVPTESGSNSRAVGDNFIIRQGLMFDANDTLTFIVDQDIVNNAFLSQVGRRIRVSNSLSSSEFLATDDQTSLFLNDANTFLGFDFNNFKFWTQPKITIQGLELKYTQFGPIGSRNGISFRYPSDGSQDSSYQYIQGPINSTTISLSSGALRSLSNIDQWNGTTSWTVSVAAGSNNYDLATYTYRVGTQPNLLGAGGPVSGDIVSILSGSGLLSQDKGVYLVTNVSATNFTVQGLRGSFVADQINSTNIVYPDSNSANTPFGQGNGLVTTASTHNAVLGQKIGLYGADVNSYVGVFEVKSIPSPTTLEVTFTSIDGGSVSTVQRSVVGTTVTDTIVVTGTIGSITTGSTIKVSDINSIGGGSFNGIRVASAGTGGSTVVIIHTPPTWSSSTTYGIGDSVVSAGLVYYSITSSNLNHTPASSPSNWTLMGNLVSTVVTGRLDRQPTVYGGIARTLQSSDNLRFFPISETQSSMATFINQNLSDNFTAVATSPSSPMSSNFNSYSGSDFVSSGNVTVTPYLASNVRLIRFSAAVSFKKGALITFSSTVDSNPLAVDISGQSFQIEDVNNDTIQVTVSRQSLPSETNSPHTVAQSWIAHQDTIGFGKGESYVKAYDENLPSSSNVLEAKDFILKTPLPDVTTGDVGYLIATTGDQLARITNKLANTGLSNVAEVDSAVLSSSMFVKTDTFGSDGSVQLSGGKANSASAAVVGSGSIKNSVPGVDILKDLSPTFVPGSFVSLNNTSTQNKQLAFTNSTTILIQSPLPADKSTITASSGIFYTQRSLNVTGTQGLKIEKQGSYVCISQVSGASLQISQNVQEGDWFWTGLSTSNPYNSANRGIFQVVKTFGDAFWISNSTAFEELVSGNLTNFFNFFSYDSVMPGDKLKIAGDILGQDNVGTYTVSDFAAMPVSNKIIVSSVLTAIGPVSLGIQFSNINIEEKSPLNVIKKIITVGPSESNLSDSFVGFESSALVSRSNSLLGGYIQSLSKVNAEETTNTGLDGYRAYQGLVKQLYRVIYGDPTDPTYPGVRAAGADIDIQAPLIRKIFSSWSVRVKTGVPFSEVIDSIKSVVAGYINSLGVGQPVSVSAIISQIQNVDGVIAVSLISTDPVASDSLINVQPQEVARVITADTDIQVTITNN